MRQGGKQYPAYCNSLSLSSTINVSEHRNVIARHFSQDDRRVERSRRSAKRIEMPQQRRRRRRPHYASRILFSSAVQSNGIETYSEQRSTVNVNSQGRQNNGCKIDQNKPSFSISLRLAKLVHRTRTVMVGSLIILFSSILVQLK